MTFTDKTPINFFLEKIVDQAKQDNISFSEAQLYILSLDVFDPESYSKKEIVKSFEEKTNIRKFELTAMKLPSKAYHRDISINSTLLTKYREAYKALRSRNYYLYYIVDRAIGNKIYKIGKFFDHYASDDEYLLRAIFVGFLASIQLFYFAISIISGSEVIEFSGYFFIGLTLSIWLTVILTRDYLRITRKGLYEEYFREQLHSKPRHSLKGILRLIGLLVLLSILTVNGFSRSMNALNNKDYIDLVLGLIELILCSIMMIVTIAMFFGGSKKLYL